jgi:hypothetical protein
MVYGAPLLQDVAPGRHLGEDERGAARKDTHKRRALSPTERGDTGHPVREDHQRGWPARIRWSEEAEGKKAHLLVDTLGMVLKAKVHTADLQDRAAVSLVLEGAAQEFPGLKHLWVDQGYTGAGQE